MLQEEGFAIVVKRGYVSVEGGAPTGDSGVRLYIARHGRMAQSVHLCHVPALPVRRRVQEQKDGAQDIGQKNIK